MATPDAADIDDIRDQFEFAHQNPEPPVIDDFLTGDGAVRWALLLELVHSDLELRLRKQQPAALADYLTRYPELENFPEELARILETEVKHHTQANRPIGLSGYEAAYPQLGRRVRDIFRRVGDAPPDIPGYELLEKIGQGGMGVVYRARQELLRREVAVKVILGKWLGDPVTRDRITRRMKKEPLALARIKHPNVVQVFDTGEHAGDLFLVMELVRGRSLQKRLDEDGVLPPRLAAELMAKTARAIQAAHDAGVIHRDLKPENILLEDDREPKVVDFGLARPVTPGDGATIGPTNQLEGTPAYLSPEQAMLKDELITPLVDVHGLGAVLYACLTGRPPFVLEDILTTLKNVKEVMPVAVRELRPDVPRDLETICMKCLAKEPEKRFASAGEVADDLQRYLNGKPILARPVGSMERASKWVKRNKTVSIATLAVVAALLTGTVVSLWQARLARDEAAAKEVARAEEAVHRKRAVEFRDKALDALRATTGTDVDLLIGGKKELGANEKAYLEAIAKRWQAFAKQEGTDEQSRAIRAEGHHQVACLRLKLGRRDEARSELEEAVALREKLASDFPTVPAYRSDLAGSYLLSGVLVTELGRRTEAEKQYRKALVIQEKLAADFPAVPDYRRDVGYCHLNLGLLLASLEKREEAEKHHRLALAIRKQLGADFPAVPVYRSELASSYVSLWGVLSDSGKRTEGEALCLEGLNIQQKLSTDFPDELGYRRDVGLGRINVGRLLSVLGKGAEAKEHFQKALPDQAKLANDFPSLPIHRFELACSHSNLGVVLEGLGERVEAEKQYRKALDIQEKLAADFPAVPDYRRDVGYCYKNLAHLLNALGRGMEAEENYRKALTIRQKLAADFPAIQQYRAEYGICIFDFGAFVLMSGRQLDSIGWFQKAIDTLRAIHEKQPGDETATRFLTNSHCSRAMAYDQLRRYAEAVKDWDRAIELSPPAEQAELRASRAKSRQKAGQVAEAVAEVAELTESPNWKADRWYDFACVSAVASGKIADKKQEYADRAMGWLHKAVQAGYKDAAHMKEDTDLDPLRERDDFKKLLADLTKKFPLPIAPKPRLSK